MGCLSFITLSIFIFLVTVFLIGCIEYPLLGWFTLLVIMPGIILVWRKGYVVRSVLKTKPEEKYRDKVLKQAKELDLFMFDAKKGLEYDVFWKIGIHDDYDTKLLQKSEMRKNMVMDLIYRGFIYAANYSESHYNPRRSQIKTELRYLFVTTPNR